MRSTRSQRRVQCWRTAGRSFRARARFNESSFQFDYFFFFTSAELVARPDSAKTTRNRATVARHKRGPNESLDFFVLTSRGTYRRRYIFDLPPPPPKVVYYFLVFPVIVFSPFDFFFSENANYYTPVASVLHAQYFDLAMTREPTSRYCGQ